MFELSLGGLYRHFKGGIYRVTDIATHTETGEQLVIYMNMTTRKVYARPYEMFISKVDRIKYTEATQEFRFDKIKAIQD
jgi:hypothetical protein